ncbi:unnamed protein product [Acanthosepion pharaonis]|uniref:Uncharacterized protein n=1 Tax=Acanthosepion pharaonis TaxID=158019 RepID=A0A812C8X8_ACAPH|nr:unnamed protein product [Sepia pharaonis]
MDPLSSSSLFLSLSLSSNFRDQSLSLTRLGIVHLSFYLFLSLLLPFCPSGHSSLSLSSSISYPPVFFESFDHWWSLSFSISEDSPPSSKSMTLAFFSSGHLLSLSSLYFLPLFQLFFHSPLYLLPFSFYLCLSPPSIFTFPFCLFLSHTFHTAIFLSFYLFLYLCPPSIFPLFIYLFPPFIFPISLSISFSLSSFYVFPFFSISFSLFYPFPSSLSISFYPSSVYRLSFSFYLFLSPPSIFSISLSISFFPFMVTFFYIFFSLPPIYKLLSLFIHSLSLWNNLSLSLSVLFFM